MGKSACLAGLSNLHNSQWSQHHAQEGVQRGVRHPQGRSSLVNKPGQKLQELHSSRSIKCTTGHGLQSSATISPLHSLPRKRHISDPSRRLALSSTHHLSLVWCRCEQVVAICTSKAADCQTKMGVHGLSPTPLHKAGRFFIPSTLLGGLEGGGQVKTITSIAIALNQDTPLLPCRPSLVVASWQTRHSSGKALLVPMQFLFYLVWGLKLQETNNGPCCLAGGALHSVNRMMPLDSSAFSVLNNGPNNAMSQGDCGKLTNLRRMKEIPTTNLYCNASAASLL